MNLHWSAVLSRKSNPTQAQMITTSEAAIMLHVNVNTIRKWANQGILEGYRLGRRGDRRFIKDKISELLALKQFDH